MKSIHFFLGVCLVAGLMSCSTALVKSDYDHEVDFTGHQTFAWTAQSQKSDSNDYAQNSLLEKRIHNAVERELVAKGFRKQTTGTPDFLITYRVDFDDKLKVISQPHDHWPVYYGGYWPRYFGSRYYYWPGIYSTEDPYVREYKEFTLTLDVLNPETKELIWRGWYVDEVEDVNLRGEKISAAVMHILEKFPPAPKEGNAPVGIT